MYLFGRNLQRASTPELVELFNSCLALTRCTEYLEDPQLMAALGARASEIAWEMSQRDAQLRLL